MQSSTSTLDRRRFLVGTGTTVAASTVASNAASASESATGSGDRRRHRDERESRDDRPGSGTDRATIIAHRGFADTYPENTLAAFRLATKGGSSDRAASRGADWVELDVFPTADGDVAVFHDEHLGDLTDTEGVIYETPSTEVFSAEVLGSGQTVPSLEEAMAAVPSGVGVNVDVKPGSPDVTFGRVDDPDAERGEWEWLETVVEIATRYRNELLFSTFWECALATVRDIAPDQPAAYLLSDSIRDGLDVTDEYDTDAINPPLSMIAGTPFFDDSYEAIDLVSEAHDRDIPVNVWTVDTWYEAERLLDAGVDGLFVDYPGIVRWGALGDDRSR